MKVSLNYDENTGLITIRSSGGDITMSQTEVAGLYVILHKTLGLRGRFQIWRKRRFFTKEC